MMASMSSGLCKDDCRPLKIEFHAGSSEAHMMGSCMRRLPFHPEDGIGPKSITVTPAMAKHNSRVRQNDIQSPIIVGHSFGGGVALLTTMFLASDKEHSPRALILIDSAAYAIDLPFFVSYLRIPIINRMILSLTSAQYKAKYTLDRIYYDKNKITDDKVARYAFFMQGPDYGYALIETASDVIPPNFESYTSKYKDIFLPSLIIWGENDSAIPLPTG